MIEADHDLRRRFVKHLAGGRRKSDDGKGRRRGIPWQRAIRDPLPDYGNHRAGQVRTAERHACADRGMPFQLLNDVAQIRIARLDSKQAWNLGAGNANQQVVAVGRIQAQSFRRIGAGMTHRADGRKDLRLNRTEVGRERSVALGARHQRLAVRIESCAVPGAAGEQPRRCDRARCSIESPSPRLSHDCPWYRKGPTLRIPEAWGRRASY